MHEESPCPPRPQLLRQEAIDARISPDWFRRQGRPGAQLWLAGVSVVACAMLFAWFAQTRQGALVWLPAVVAAPSACVRASDRAEGGCQVKLLMSATPAALSRPVPGERVAVRCAQGICWMPVLGRGDPADPAHEPAATLVVEWPLAVPLPAELDLGVPGPGASLLSRLFPQPAGTERTHGQ